MIAAAINVDPKWFWHGRMRNLSSPVAERHAPAGPRERIDPQSLRTDRYWKEAAGDRQSQCLSSAPPVHLIHPLTVSRPRFAINNSNRAIRGSKFAGAAYGPIPTYRVLSATSFALNIESSWGGQGDLARVVLPEKRRLGSFFDQLVNAPMSGA
jgi:hypothetical protein